MNTDLRKEIRNALIDILKYDDIEESIDRFEALFQKREVELIERCLREVVEIEKPRGRNYCTLAITKILDELKEGKAE
jgi:hypothetical protein